MNQWVSKTLSRIIVRKQISQISLDLLTFQDKIFKLGLLFCLLVENFSIEHSLIAYYCPRTLFKSYIHKKYVFLESQIGTPKINNYNQIQNQHNITFKIVRRHYCQTVNPIRICIFMLSPYLRVCVCVTSSSEHTIAILLAVFVLAQYLQLEKNESTMDTRNTRNTRTAYCCNKAGISIS